ncbi:MAG TPA: serine/threonine-protein kinase [Gemmatirosa sp.]
MPPAPPPRLPPHLASWQLPPGWSWGSDAREEQYRHYQEIIDALGRSLSLVTAPDPAHAPWLLAEARALAHRSHPTVPTTYHYWVPAREPRRGPGYLRRWIGGEPLRARVDRHGAEGIPAVLRLLREAGAAVAYLHDSGGPHGAVSPSTLWLTSSGRLWLLGWQWAVPRDRVPAAISPDPVTIPRAPEERARWTPTVATDQWQLAAVAFFALTGEMPPAGDVPPIRLLRPECPASAADVIERALDPDPTRRFGSVAAMVRALDRGVGVRPTPIVATEGATGETVALTAEARLRWATGDDYETLAPLGAGTFGSVWRVRDLSLGREVALKMLHPHVARDADAVARFRREATLAAQLAHPALVPIFDFDSRGGVSWYTMELADGGSLAELVRRAGARTIVDVAAQVEFVLEGLAAAHAIGVVHRDLKPENLLIDRYRRWRVSDFGIASALGEEVTGASGTPAFAPPEQLLGEPQGAAVDVFAMGAILYYALESQPPFAGVDGPAVLASQMRGAPPLDRFPVALAEFLRRALDPEPERRFADAGAMLGAWRRIRVAAERVEQRARWWRRVLRPVMRASS